MNGLEPMTRETAKSLNLKNYVPLEPCVHGHVYLRSTKFGNCLACQNLKNAGIKLRPVRTVDSITPMTRESAQNLGLTRYVPLEPCNHGHTSFRSTKFGYCLDCQKLKNAGVKLRPAKQQEEGRFEVAYLSPEAKQAVQAYASQWLEYDEGRIKARAEAGQ